MKKLNVPGDVSGQIPAHWSPVPLAYYPIETPDPVEAIKFRMEQQGLTVKDLEPAIGKSNRVYEVLNRKRNLTLPMIRKLHTMFGIPLKSLVGG
ncbi:helix-turn-helix domain-containing protein [Citrobacter portucalensis]|uniref:helix-turn-helix domain-containing protein n=1 Tax=Citrobacter portucalensis TaxID=1639133 RepID=UPI003F761276